MELQRLELLWQALEMLEVLKPDECAAMPQDGGETEGTTKLEASAEGETNVGNESCRVDESSGAARWV